MRFYFGKHIGEDSIVSPHASEGKKPKKQRSAVKIIERCQTYDTDHLYDCSGGHTSVEFHAIDQIVHPKRDIAFLPEKQMPCLLWVAKNSIVENSSVLIITECIAAIVDDLVDDYKAKGAENFQTEPDPEELLLSSLQVFETRIDERQRINE